MNHFAFCEIKDAKEARLKANGDSNVFLARGDGGGRVNTGRVKLVDLLHGLCMPNLDRTVLTDCHKGASHAIMSEVHNVILVRPDQHSKRA